MVFPQIVVILVVALAILALYVFTNQNKVRGGRSFSSKSMNYRSAAVSRPKARKIVKARKPVKRKVKRKR